MSDESVGGPVDRDVGRDLAETLLSTRASMLGTQDEQHYWDCQEAAAELDSLRAEVAIQKRSRQIDANEAMSREQALRAENEALQADAARWRHLLAQRVVMGGGMAMIEAHRNAPREELIYWIDVRIEALTPNA